MRADNEGGRQFYSHLRDAFEAFESGNRADAEHSMMAAAAIDADALLAVEWWNYIRAEREAADTATAAQPDLSNVATAFDEPATIDPIVEREPALERTSTRTWGVRTA